MINYNLNLEKFFDIRSQFLLRLFQEYQTFTLPLWRQILWTILFGIMVVIATVGNILVIWIVIANKRMRNVTNFLLGEYFAYKCHIYKRPAVQTLKRKGVYNKRYSVIHLQQKWLRKSKGNTKVKNFFWNVVCSQRK